MFIYATPVIGIVYLIQCFSDLTITNVEQSNKVNKAIYTSKQSNIYFISSNKSKPFYIEINLELKNVVQKECGPRY